MAPSPKAQRLVNRWAARIIPGVLIGIVGYATWVAVVLIAVDHLLYPPDGFPRRRGIGISIIVIYFVLFLLMSTSYLRTLQVVLLNPGYVPLPGSSRKHRRGRQTPQQRQQHGDIEKQYDTSDSGTACVALEQNYLDRGAVQGGRLSPPGGLEAFYKRDVFECEIDGMPRWCSNCELWKPDRSHHSSETGRCTYKMDHFCPWAGGIVSETTFKFFTQFCFYAMLFCTFGLIVIAYFTAQRHNNNGTYDVNWIIIIALCGLFFIFSFGMAYNSLLAVFMNSTTVDTLARSSRVQHFAILLPKTHPLTLYEQHKYTGLASQSTLPPPPPTPTSFSTITFPLRNSQSGQTIQSQQNVRVFAILAPAIGGNPYLLGTRLENFKTVMGDHWYDWILPIRHSPCYTRRQQVQSLLQNSERSGRSENLMYELGSVMEEMKRDAGLLPASSRVVETDRYGRKHIRERAVTDS